MSASYLDAPFPGETEDAWKARLERVAMQLARMSQNAGRTRPDLGEQPVITSAPNPLGDPRKPQDRR